MAGNARVNQALIEVIGKPAGTSNIRVNQTLFEVIGQPSGTSNVRVNQALIEVIGIPLAGISGSSKTTEDWFV